MTLTAILVRAKRDLPAAAVPTNILLMIQGKTCH